MKDTIHLYAGGIGIVLGLIALGISTLKAQDANWLDGPESTRRKLLKLGNLGFICIGLLNIMVALMEEQIDLSLDASVLKGVSFVLALCLFSPFCYLGAWKPSLGKFAIFPMVVLIAGTLITVWGLI